MDNNSTPIINDILAFKSEIEMLLKNMNVTPDQWGTFQTIWLKYVPDTHVNREAVRSSEEKHYCNIDTFWFDLEEIVAKVYNIESAIMYTVTRKREIVEARQFMFFFIRMNYPRVSLARVGSRYKKDHSTVLHSFRNMGYLIDLDREYKYKYQLILDNLQAKEYHFANNTLEQWEQYKLSCDDNGKRKFGKHTAKNKRLRRTSRKANVKRKEK